MSLQGYRRVLNGIVRQVAWLARNGNDPPKIDGNLIYLYMQSEIWLLFQYEFVSVAQPSPQTGLLITVIKRVYGTNVCPKTQSEVCIYDAHSIMIHS